MSKLARANYLNYSAVNPPQYSMDQVKIGVLHMGLGAFHRAHQAVFFDRLLRSGNLNYGICGVSQRSSTVADSMNAQDCLYTVNAQDGQASTPTIIGALREARYFPRDLERILEIARSPDLKMITLTVSEKAYRSDDASQLPQRLVTILRARYESGLPGIAVISCDNLPSNGAFTRKIILDVITEKSSGFFEWANTQIRFPNSMVDRIVPAITSKSIDDFEQRYGYRDDSLISTEPYNEWVIEDDALSQDLTPAGIRFVPRVAPYELTKIRLFNGNHSTLAYISQLCGIEYVHEAIIDSAIAPFVSRLQEEELGLSFKPPHDIDLKEYARTVRKRVSNPTLLHRAEQIAMDGSQKLPQRLFSPANDLLQLGLPTQRISLAIAAWLHFLATKDQVNDPLADQLQPLARLSEPMSAVSQTLGFAQLATKVNPALFPMIAAWLEKLRSTPIKEVLIELERGSV
ncbi:MAG: mannitol dehydrogenase family protein [Actinomycetes bacterium]